MAKNILTNCMSACATDAPVNVRPNVFTDILRPSGPDKTRSHGALQMELHFRIAKEFDRFTILLNNMRIMGIFDWLLACKDFLLTGPEDPFKEKNGQGRSKVEYKNHYCGLSLQN